MVSSFVYEVAHNPRAQEMLQRLRQDHAPDRHGRCTHPTHAYRWERHPCATLRLADVVEGGHREQPLYASWRGLLRSSPGVVENGAALP